MPPKRIKTTRKPAVICPSCENRIVDTLGMLLLRIPLSVRVCVRLGCIESVLVCPKQHSQLPSQVLIPNSGPPTVTLLSSKMRFVLWSNLWVTFSLRLLNRNPSWTHYTRVFLLAPLSIIPLLIMPQQPLVWRVLLWLPLLLIIWVLLGRRLPSSWTLLRCCNQGCSRVSQGDIKNGQTETWCWWSYDWFQARICKLNWLLWEITCSWGSLTLSQSTPGKFQLGSLEPLRESAERANKESTI